MGDFRPPRPATSRSEEKLERSKRAREPSAKLAESADIPKRARKTAQSRLAVSTGPTSAPLPPVEDRIDDQNEEDLEVQPKRLLQRRFQQFKHRHL